MDVQKELAAIKERNRRVEIDKAWEVSWTRRLFIGGATYLTTGAWLIVIGDAHPWFNALLPAGGYILSTFSLPFVKKWWAKGRLPI